MRRSSDLCLAFSRGKSSLPRSPQWQVFTKALPLSTYSGGTVRDSHPVILFSISPDATQWVIKLSKILYHSPHPLSIPPYRKTHPPRNRRGGFQFSLAAAKITATKRCAVCLAPSARGLSPPLGGDWGVSCRKRYTPSVTEGGKGGLKSAPTASQIQQNIPRPPQQKILNR